MASFTVEEFSARRLKSLTRAEIALRCKDFVSMTRFAMDWFALKNGS